MRGRGWAWWLAAQALVAASAADNHNMVKTWELDCGESSSNAAAQSLMEINDRLTSKSLSLVYLDGVLPSAEGAEDQCSPKSGPDEPKLSPLSDVSTLYLLPDCATKNPEKLQALLSYLTGQDYRDVLLALRRADDGKFEAHVGDGALIKAGVPAQTITKLKNQKLNVLTVHWPQMPANGSSCTLTGQGDDADPLRSFSKTSVLFVSVSFIILMVISLAWLVFYYVQRFRYAHAKDRLARRLFNAAKKALTKIPTRALRALDRELDTDCPVCIEPYRHGDVIRTLPCKHVFHKTCVDPWLLEHRTCPMCKSDILKAFGYHLGHSEDSVRAPDEAMDGVSQGGASSDGAGSSSGPPYPYPVTDSDIHDPFFPSPAPSPSLVQQVVHPGSASGFSIIPLTVHSSGSVSRPTLGSAPRQTAIPLTAVSSSSTPALPPLGPRSSDSSAEVAVSEDPRLAGVEVHQPLGSTDASDSHGHSASCESSSDSDSSATALTSALSKERQASLGSPTLLSTSTEPLFRPRPLRSPLRSPSATLARPGALEWASVSSGGSSGKPTAVVISPSRRRASQGSSKGSARRVRRGLSSASSEAQSPEAPPPGASQAPPPSSHSHSSSHSRRFEPKRHRPSEPAVKTPTRASRVGSLESL